MKILSIETSCDETAIAIIEAKKEKQKVKFNILANEVSSQASLHAQYGGVFPMMAKREHAKNIVYLLEKSLRESGLYKSIDNNFPEKKISSAVSLKKRKQIEKILEKEKDLFEKFKNQIFNLKKPKIDAIALTVGPGLEPALWVGINFAKALSILWNIPVIPVNHMEGHIYSVFPEKSNEFFIDLKDQLFPVLSLLVSGGHTELVLIKNYQKYEKIGGTRDDSVGEAFDKVARMLSLPYPGGPEIGRLAEEERSRESKRESNIFLPRPMIKTNDYDFSFSGLKTAVLYLIRDLKKLDDETKSKIAREFEDACVDVLTAKTIKAIKSFKIKTLIVGGGVSANNHLRKTIIERILENNLDIKTHFPNKEMTGDNALMIAISGYFQYQKKKFTKKIDSIKANGNLSL